MRMLNQYRNNRFNQFVRCKYFNAFSKKKWLELMANA